MDMGLCYDKNMNTFRPIDPSIFVNAYKHFVEINLVCLRPGNLIPMLQTSVYFLNVVE